MKLIFALIAGMLLINNAYSGTSTPSSGQPLPSTLGSQWVIYKNVEYENGFLKECSNVLFQGKKCSKGLTPQEVINKEKGMGYVPIGISPFISYSGDQLGIVLYYKKEIQKETEKK